MATENLKIIITGATGMVGEGVLHVALKNQSVEKVLIINRKSLGLTHPKLTEIIHTDFYDITAISDAVTDYDACFFCLGISSLGMSEQEYTKITYNLTLNFAATLSRLNPNMTFEYISGAGTSSSEKGGSMWARVKGKTENDLMKLPFKQVYALRPGFILPVKGLTKTHNFYKYIAWLFPIGKAIYPAGFCKLSELTKAMIYLAIHPQEKKIIEGGDIINLAKNAF